MRLLVDTCSDTPAAWARPGVDELRWHAPGPAGRHARAARHGAGGAAVAEQARSRHGALPGGGPQPGQRARGEHGRRGVRRPPPEDWPPPPAPSPAQRERWDHAIVPLQLKTRPVRWGSEQLRGGVRPTNPSNLISGSRAGRTCAAGAEDERRECGRRTATTVVRLWLRGGLLRADDQAEPAESDGRVTAAVRDGRPTLAPASSAPLAIVRHSSRSARCRARRPRGGRDGQRSIGLATTEVAESPLAWKTRDVVVAAALAVPLGHHLEPGLGIRLELRPGDRCRSLASSWTASTSWQASWSGTSCGGRARRCLARCWPP